jgi:hypothetical protein
MKHIQETVKAPPPILEIKTYGLEIGATRSGASYSITNGEEDGSGNFTKFHKSCPDGDEIKIVIHENKDMDATVTRKRKRGGAADKTYVFRVAISDTAAESQVLRTKSPRKEFKSLVARKPAPAPAPEPAPAPAPEPAPAPAPEPSRTVLMPAVESPDVSDTPPVPGLRTMTPIKPFAPTQTRKRVAVVKNTKNGSARRTQKKRINRRKT